MTDSGVLSALKQRMKATWMAGDFGQIARINERSGEEFVDRLHLQPGMRILDVACGTGNQSIPAARTGARVTGLDIAPNLLEQARERARAEDLKVDFVEGDAEDLPYEAGEFDVVLSMFGAMFAPRPERVVAEFHRVCRPGGLIAMGNWTPQGFIGQTFALMSRHVAPPPGIVSAILWGDEAVVAERFGGKAKIQTARRAVFFEVPFGPEQTVNLFRTYFGPIKTAFEQLDAAGQQALHQDLVALWTIHNEATNGRTALHLEFLEVHARPN
ncbi:MAG: class I SAM-dependent methyltransferase [Silvibacterium sp.]|nr:class I SAM-dependent methyltransferase [Silvibacterium sp.]